MYEHKESTDPIIDFQLESIRLQLELFNRFFEKPSREDLDSELLLNRYGVRVVATIPLMYGIHRAARDVGFLATHDSLGSAYVLGRAVVEMAINYCFLQCCDEEHFQEWISYSRQKAFRLLSKSKTAGDLSFKLALASIPGPSEIPGLQDDLNRFTSQRGREKTRWIKLSLEDRISVASERIQDFKVPALFLLSSLGLTYDMGSESVHGTLYGVGFPLGLFMAPGESAESQISLLLHAAASSAYAVLNAVGKTSDEPELAERSHHIFAERVEETRRILDRRKSNGE